jgi:uncharacterized protein (UPF0276 family)
MSRTEPSRRPSLAFSYSGRDATLLERLLPVVDAIEITPDDLVTLAGGEIRLDLDLVAPLRDLATELPVVAHGIGLSIASHDGPAPVYLRILDELFEQLDLAWHSEHLGYTTVDGGDLGTMLNVPRTDAVVELIAGRAAAIRRRYGRPFLLENVAALLPDPGGELDRAAFANAIARASGCGVLLDVHNLECDATNEGADPHRYLDEIDADAVVEIHVAGGVMRGPYRLDVHSNLSSPSTVALARRALRRSPAATVTFELLAQAVPVVGPDSIIEHMRYLAGALTGDADQADETADDGGTP